MSSNVSSVSVSSSAPTFIIPSGIDGFSCYGFENCFNDSLQLSQLLERPELAPKGEEKGTLKQYSNYRHLIDIAKNRDIGTWFTPGTDGQVKRILQGAIDSKSSLRIYYGDVQTGRSWMDEYNMFGKISRTSGTLKTPIIVAPGEDGGEAILAHCIVKIVAFSKRDGIEFGRVLYQHKNFNIPSMTIELGESEKYAATVMVDGKPEARFKTVAKAQKWIDFMLGLTSKT
jgi:hypothetical protein